MNPLGYAKFNLHFIQLGQIYYIVRNEIQVLQKKIHKLGEISTYIPLT